MTLMMCGTPHSILNITIISNSFLSFLRSSASVLQVFVIDASEERRYPVQRPIHTITVKLTILLTILASTPVNDHVIFILCLCAAVSHFKCVSALNSNEFSLAVSVLSKVITPLYHCCYSCGMDFAIHFYLYSYSRLGVNGS